MRRRNSNSPRYDVAFYFPWLAPMLAREPGPSPGGAETQLVLLAQALAERGARVSLSAFDIQGAGIPASQGRVAIALRPDFVSGGGVLGQLREILATRRAVADPPAEVVVTRTAGFHVGLVGLFVRLSGRRFIYSSAGVSNFDFDTLTLNARDLALYRLGLRLAHDIVVQTDEQSALCRERLGRTPTVIKSIVELAPARTAEPEAFLWVGRHVSIKQPLAYVDLARAVPDAKFWMVSLPGLGAADLSDEVERAAADVPNLELLPPRPRSELMDLIERAVAIVNTSASEGMPNANLEGWARGVPALALAYDPDGIIERHGLGEFAHGSGEGFAAAAEELWQGRRQQRELADRCRRYVAEEHSPGVVAAQWEQALGLPSVPLEPALEGVA